MVVPDIPCLFKYLTAESKSGIGNDPNRGKLTRPDKGGWAFASRPKNSTNKRMEVNIFFIKDSLLSKNSETIQNNTALQDK
jgi:hypothetical protein